MNELKAIQKDKNKEIALNILEQLKAFNPAFRFEYGIKCFVIVKNGLRLHLHKNMNEYNIRNIDIVLNGLDLYDISFHSFKGLTEVETTIENDIYFDSLELSIRAKLFNDNK